MKRKILLILAVVVVLCGCGGGVDDILVGDVYYDDDYGYDLIAIDDQYSTFQNQSLTVGEANGILANDFICCDDFELKAPSETASGGILVVNEDGSFSYTPPANFTGTDFFDYTLEDDYGSSVANVIIAVNVPPSNGFVVDSLSGNDATGSGVTGSPYATVQSALAAAGPNGTVVVREGSGAAYAGAINLLAGQTLVGEGFEQVNLQGSIRPTLTGPVNLADNCVLRGLEIDGGRVSGFGASSGEVSQCDLINVAGYALNLDGASGDWLVEDNLIENCGGGVTVALQGQETLSVNIGFNTIQDNTQSAILMTADDSSALVAGLFNNLMLNQQAGRAVEIVANDSASVCLDLDGNQNDNSYRLTNNGTIFKVEQLGLLTTLNTGAIDITADPLSLAGDGECGF